MEQFEPLCPAGHETTFKDVTNQAEVDHVDVKVSFTGGTVEKKNVEVDWDN